MITPRFPERYAAPTLNTDQCSLMPIDSNFFRVTDFGNLFYTFVGVLIVTEGIDSILLSSC